MNNTTREMIIVRSLTESDLGIFAAHRTSARSKQRAININSKIARQLLSSELYANGEAELNCVCAFGHVMIHTTRRVGKTHKNWRLGGPKIQGEIFAKLDAKDFILIRSAAGNDGTHPVTITLVCRDTDRVRHAGIAAIVERKLTGSMTVFKEGEDSFDCIADCCPANYWTGFQTVPEHPVPPMPKDTDIERPRKKNRTIEEKLRTPHILEQMLKVAGDLSAPAQLRFVETVTQLATQLRQLLLATGGIVQIARDHATLWESVSGKPIGFVDGGLANLSMFGSAPVAARVGGYTVIPGAQGPEREKFTVLKHLINELYARDEEGVFEDSFPDVNALRDAARISIEAAGAVQMLSTQPDLSYVFLHGALVNPVSRYTDVMRDGLIRHRFPDFSDTALADFLPPGEPTREGRDRNFISVHLRQLEILEGAKAIICGVVERESTTTSVCHSVLDDLQDEFIRDLLPEPPTAWKQWFRRVIDPTGDTDFEGQRITDSLLFRCVLEPGEALLPVQVDRNDLRRAPETWREIIHCYPKPQVSYLQVTEWNAPVRIELFRRILDRFREIAKLVMHCALLLPRYAFPVGLDIVDKFARIPDWMSRPINTHAAVQAMKRALDQGDLRLFDALRHMLCGSGREFFLRPSIYH